MNFKTTLTVQQKRSILTQSGLILILLLGACTPATAPVIPTSIVIENTATTAPTSLPAVTSTATLVPLPATSIVPAEDLVFPYYLSLATKPDPVNASQTIDGVTATIDQLYVDEIRIYVGFTVTGLDWPDGTQWDPMQLRISSTAIPDNAFSGAGWWNVTPAEAGMIAGEANVLLVDGGLNAEKTPNINVRVDLPLEGPTSSVNFRLVYQVPVLNGMRIDNIDQTVVANNVSMTLKTLLVQPSYVEAKLCFDMPAPVDWGLTASRLTLGDREYAFSGGGLIDGPRGEPFTLNDPQRCVSIGFDVLYDETQSNVTLTVPKLLASVPEVINAERVSTANMRLAPLGIEIDYVNVDHGGTINVLKRPDGATDGEIYPLIWDALAEQYEGPWVFTVPIK